jgi:hypothetical protein
MAASPRTTTSNGRMRAASNCGARRCTASTAAILTRRGPTTNREWRTGASAWPASRARRSTSNAQGRMPQRLGAPHGAQPAVGARQREGPRGAAVVRAGPQHAACVRIAAGRQGLCNLRWSPKTSTQWAMRNSLHAIKGIPHPEERRMARLEGRKTVRQFLVQPRSGTHGRHHRA